MKATVEQIDLNYVHNGRKCALIITQGDPYQGQSKPPRRHLLFPTYAQTLIDKFKNVKVGDRIEYQVSNDQYRNMLDFTVISDTQHQTPTGSAFDPTKPSHVDLRITRAAAMKEATQIVLHTDDSRCIEDIVSNIIEVTKTLERFLIAGADTCAPEYPVHTDDDLPY